MAAPTLIRTRSRTLCWVPDLQIPVANLLISQFLIYAMAWAVGALLLREQRLPLALWSAYCVVQAVGLALQVEMAAQPGGLPAQASLVMLLAYVLAVSGLDMFINGRLRYPELWFGVGGVAMAVQLVAVVWPVPMLWRAAAHNLGVGLFLLTPLLVMRRALVREFGYWGLLAMLPGLVMGAFAFVGTGYIISRPELLTEAPAQLPQNEALLLVTLFAAGAFNIGLIGMVVGRLVLRLRRRLDTDALSELANRNALEKHLNLAWATSERQRAPLSLAFIDIDNFKQINDTAGHEAGDRVIKCVAQALRQSARFTDHVGRWGGDEFMVVMPNTPDGAAHQAMQRLRDQIESAKTNLPPNCGVLTVSIGIVTKGEDDATMEDLVMRADAQMYVAKRERRHDTQRELLATAG